MVLNELWAWFLVTVNGKMDEKKFFLTIFMIMF